MKYFITGATGFIGGRLARRLVADGHRVVALVRNPEKAQDLAALGIELAPGDILDKESMRVPMQGVDGIYHVAAWYKIGADPAQAEAINAGGTRNVLEMMKELNIPKGVYTSTVGINSDTRGRIVDESYHLDTRKQGFLTHYERTKWIAHYEVALPMMEAGLPLVIVQPGVVYGPGDNSSISDTLRDYLQGKLPMLPRDLAFMWAHVDDVVTGHILAMEKGRAGESYIIAGEAATLIEAITLAERISGVAKPNLQVAPVFLKILAAVLSPISRFINLPPAYHPETLNQIAGATYLADNGKARRELGYAPRSLAEAFPETIIHEMRELGMPLPKA